MIPTNKGMNNFIIKTLGCKVNQCESEAIARCLTMSGWTLAEKDATVCIVNTCTVTQKASMQSRQAVRRFIRTYPDSYIIVTGCYAQTESDEIEKIEGVNYIIGHADKHKIPDIIKGLARKGRQDIASSRPVSVWREIMYEHDFMQIPALSFGCRTRPFLKIQDGCNAFCTYCIVPHARGPSRSMKVESVLENIIQLKNKGCREVVLSGIHLGRYGLDLSPKTGLYELLCRIDASTPIERVRLSSIEPCELTGEIIELAARSEIICRHFHIPLQSGDDHILQRMNRPYTNVFFSDLIYKISESIPDAAIGVDTLIGFPGETEDAFENTYLAIEKLPVAYLHVFPFSPRKGTPANGYPDKISTKIIKERCRRMRRLGLVKKKSFYEKFIGKKVDVLVEGGKKGSNGIAKGITSNYIPVYLKGENILENTIIKGKIEKLCGNNSVHGRLC